MKRTTNPLIATLVALAIGLSACATTVPESGRLGVVDGVLRGAAATNSVSLALSPTELRPGEQMRAQVSAARAGYLYLYQLATDGKTLTLVFPNAVDGANHVAAGTTALPRNNWRMTSKGPAGVAYFVAVLAEKPQNLQTIDAAVQQGRIDTDGPYAAAMAMTREVKR